MLYHVISCYIIHTTIMHIIYIYISILSPFERLCCLEELQTCATELHVFVEVLANGMPREALQQAVQVIGAGAHALCHTRYHINIHDRILILWQTRLYCDCVTANYSIFIKICT